MKKNNFKNIYTIMTFVLTFVLIAALTPTTSFASNNTLSEVEEKDLKEQAVFIIEANTQEEYDKIMEEINEHNKKAEDLWNKALIQSEESENQISNFNTIQPNLIQPNAYGVQSKYHSVLINGNRAYLTFSATYDRGYSSYYYFNQVYDVNANARDSNTSVSKNHIQHKLIDGRRTLAANYSLLVGVKTFGGDFIYTNFVFYVEFYASGGAYVW